MPKRSERSSVDKPEHIYAPSSSSDEDWGDDEWEVEGIIGEHTAARGDRRYQVAWEGWTRPDGTNWTWEKEDGTTMQDLSNMLRAWRKEKSNESRLHVYNPLVSPFHPYVLPEDEETSNGIEEPDPTSKQKNTKKLPVRYAFTELTHQAHEMALDIRDEADFEPSHSLTSAFERLQALRTKRDAALKALDVELQDTVSQSLYELGPAPTKDGRYQPQKRVSLHRRMESLQVSRNIPKRPGKFGVSRSPLPVSQPGTSEDVSRPSLPEARVDHETEFVFSRHMPTNQKGFEIPKPVLPVRQPEASNYTISRQGRPLHESPRATLRRQEASLPSPSLIKFPFTFSSQHANRPPSKSFWDSGSTVTMSTNEETNTCVPSATVSMRDVVQGSCETGSANGGAPARVQSVTVSTRDALQAQLSAAVQAAGAASVKIVNDLNDDEIPVLNPKTFKYLESDYIYGSGVARSEDGFMEACECNSRCTASHCSCQDDSEILEDDGTSKTFAYDDNGLFTFSETLTSYVIECNKNCRCDLRCRSRVAQRPRAFPVEIFRTERCGWGVRSTVALPRGSVLGVYTGELLSRETAKKFSVHRASYIADLDFMVTGSQSGYSVDAYNCGNWTRFINHSCDPVCSLYSVIWDSVPSMHQPKLAFVAKVYIPAGRELTIDYCPQARKGKGRAKRKMPDTPDCMCGAESCRGFIYLG